MLKTHIRILSRAFVVALLAIVSLESPVHAFTVSEAPDSYERVDDAGLKEALLTALAAAGVSSVGSFYQLVVPGDAIDRKRTNASAEDDRVVLQIVQDRGLPLGDLYPTYVFKPAATGRALDLIFKTEAGKRIYHAEGHSESGCLFSAEKGYSDICLVDVSGNPAPELPGLRNDIWTDLIRLLGL